MKTLFESLNFSLLEVDSGYLIKVTETGRMNAYDTLELICKSLNIDTSEYDREDFFVSANALEDFYKASQAYIRTIHDDFVIASIWID